MTIEDIEKFLQKANDDAYPQIKITFKKREPVFGVFVKDKDYQHLKSKNFWRIVTRLHSADYRKSKDLSLARIFNGAEFSRLTFSEEAVEKA